MTILEVITRITNLYEQGIPTIDSKLSQRHVYSKILTVRSKLLSQQSSKKQRINQFSYQTIDCIEMIPESFYNTSIINDFTCGTIRSKNPIPKIISDLNKELIQIVSNLDGSIVFSETSFQSKKYKQGSKYTREKIDYFINNNYLYLTTKSNIKFITMTALFDNPLDAILYPSLCKVNTNTCKNMLDNELPIDNDMIDTLVDMCKTELIQQFAQRQIQQPTEQQNQEN